MNKFCIPVDLQVSPLREDLDFKNYSRNLPGSKYDIANHVAIPLNDLNPVLISKLNDLNVNVYYAEVFYTNPETNSAIHIDDVGGDYVKLNFIFGGDDSTMRWYTPNQNCALSPSKTITGSPYVPLRPDDVTFADEYKILKSAVVQVGIPHNIHNPVTGRYCISLTLVKSGTKISGSAPPDLNDRISMEDAVSLFKKYMG